MKLFEEKFYPKIEPYRWFAWYPVWCWDTDKYDILFLVWLQKVWRINGYKIQYRHFLKKSNQ